MVEVNLKAKKYNASKQKSKSLDVDEIQKCREIQFLHHSNLLRLQIEEMISTLEIKNKTKIKLQLWFDKFSEFLKAIPKSREFQLSNLKWLQEHRLNLPVKELSQLPRIKGSFTFVPPTKIIMIGSYDLDLASKHSRVIDVALVLSKDFMQHNDLLNGKWILRRALYLTWLGKLLQKETDLISSVSWTLQCGSRLRPVLQVTPAEKYDKKWKINLFPIPQEDHFKINLISPTKGNISPSWYFRKEISDNESESPPTPYHNWVCSVDLVVLKHKEFIKNELKHPTWIEGVKLLKIWLKQRNLTMGEGSFSSHLMTLFVAYLGITHKIYSKMSQYQVFRTALLQIDQTDWTQEGPSLFKKSEISDRNVVVPDLQDFHRFYPVVFVDHTGFSNIAGNVSIESYKQLKHEVKISLKILGLSSPNFEALFISKTEFMHNSDQMAKISFDVENIKNICSKIEKDSPNFDMDRLGDVNNVVFSHVVSVLSEGLADRVDLVCVSKEKDVTWDFGLGFSSDSQELILGFRVNPRKSVALLTKGPSADSEEVENFREFWGDKSSLRRFRDSTFHEAVLWMESGAPVGDRRLILGKIVHYIMQQHFNVTSNKIQYIANQLEDVLRPRVSLNRENFMYGTGEELISSAIISFDNLAKKLRSLSLPLQVTGVQSISDVLKHAIVFPPLPSRVPKPFVQIDSKRLKLNYQEASAENICSPFYRPSINVQIFLEISGKWPDDLLAIKGVKQEFLLHISKLLENDGITCVHTPNCLLVVWEGYVFSIKVCYRREIYLLKSSDSEDVTEAGRQDTEASFSLEKEIEILPKLTSSLSSLQSEYSCFSSSVRLVRRWVSSQLLIPHFPHTVTDLLVAYLFLNPYPYSTPNTPHVALLRFMKLMASTDWRCTPIFVNLRSQLTENDENELTARFTNNRPYFPPLFICTPCELRPLPDGSEPTPEDWSKRIKYASCWSRSGPPLVILSRMKVVAEASLKAYESSLWKNTFDFKALFRPRLTDYHVVIYLKETQISRRLEHIDNDEEMCFESYSHSKGELLPVTEFDPVQLYLFKLRETFSNDALFFHDEHGGTVIGVLWKPHVFEEKEVKKSHFERHKIVGTNDMKLVTDIEAIIEEFKIISLGLVKDIKLKS